MPHDETVVVFGAGIAGLTVAHELARRGYRVAVYEPNAEAGGFFRSARCACDRNMPSEYSWHGIGPWYHNVFDLFQQIPFDESGSLFEKALSRPIDFGLATDDGHSAFDDTWLVNAKNMFCMTWLDVLRGSWLMLKTWASDARSRKAYSNQNAAQAWRPYLTPRAWRVWRSSFGPWIGSDWSNVSLHTAGQFFRKQLVSKSKYFHPADKDGPAWMHGARDGWLLLKGPSNEYWFERWVRYLKTLGVEFHWQESLEELHYDGQRITGARLASGSQLNANTYVLAANPFATAQILGRSSTLSQVDQLSSFPSLISGGPHTQVSLRMAFREKIRWPRTRLALIAADSEFNLTLFAQEQAWDQEVELGDGICSLWTITACVATEPGPIHDRPLENCTKAQFIEEVKGQLCRCQGFNALLAEANGGRKLCDFDLAHIEVWHEWHFSEKGIQPRQPKWVNRVGNQQFMPSQKTPVSNLVLAGAHTQTEVDVWSIEAAVESGRRAAQVIEPSVKVVPQYCPLWLRIIRSWDNALYRLGLPNILDVVLVLCALALVALISVWTYWTWS